MDDKISFVNECDRSISSSVVSLTAGADESGMAHSVTSSISISRTYTNCTTNTIPSIGTTSTTSLIAGTNQTLRLRGRKEYHN